MNKNTKGTPDGETIFALPDVSDLYDRSADLRNRTVAVIDSMNKTSRRIHEALDRSEKVLAAASRIAKDDGRPGIWTRLKNARH